MTLPIDDLHTQWAATWTAILPATKAEGSPYWWADDKVDFDTDDLDALLEFADSGTSHRAFFLYDPTRLEEALIGGGGVVADYEMTALVVLRKSGLGDRQFKRRRTEEAARLADAITTKADWTNGAIKYVGGLAWDIHTTEAGNAVVEVTAELRLGSSA